MRVIIFGGFLDLPALVLSIISGKLEAAHRTLIVLAEPFRNAFFVEEVTTGELAGSVLQVLTADGASGVLFA